jgi:hypothetical protein
MPHTRIQKVVQIPDDHIWNLGPLSSCLPFDLDYAKEHALEHGASFGH